MMLKEKERRRMPAEQILELLDLKGWSRVRLAAELDVTENTVHQWCSGRRKASGPASVLMRMWLAEARAKAKKGQPVTA
jgi:DNA-binding transcriptional regulator YiaG